MLKLRGKIHCPYFVSIPMYSVILSVNTGKNMFEYGFLIRKSYERLKLHNNFRSEVIYTYIIITYCAYLY
jgi:hypothetical protein